MNQMCPRNEIAMCDGNGAVVFSALDLDHAREAAADVDLVLGALREAAAHGAAACAREQDACDELGRALVVAGWAGRGVGVCSGLARVCVRRRRPLLRLCGASCRARRRERLCEEILWGMRVGKRVVVRYSSRGARRRRRGRTADAYGYAAHSAAPRAGDDRRGRRAGRRCAACSACSEHREVDSPASGVGDGVERCGLVCV